MSDDVIKLGDIVNGPLEIFELVIDEHIDKIIPADFGFKYDSIDPNYYFITSGDAVQKTLAIRRDIINLQNVLDKDISPDGRIVEFREKIDKIIGQVDAFIVKIKTARGNKLFLETEWEAHQLYCIPKNPRNML